MTVDFWGAVALEFVIVGVILAFAFSGTERP